MMTPHTVQQLLQVFRISWDNHASGMPIHRSYQDAVRAVADAHSVTYQTIGDGCRRRLGLNDIKNLYDLLAAWVKGDPQPLVRQLKANSDRAAHGDIDQFFSVAQSARREKQKVSRQAEISGESETISFRLPTRDARMLRALAELEGVSAAEMTARAVAAAVRDRMAVVARGLIKETDTSA